MYDCCDLNPVLPSLPDSRACACRTVEASEATFNFTVVAYENDTNKRSLFVIGNTFIVSLCRVGWLLLLLLVVIVLQMALPIATKGV